MTGTGFWTQNMLQFKSCFEGGFKTKTNIRYRKIWPCTNVNFHSFFIWSAYLNQAKMVCTESYEHAANESKSNSLVKVKNLQIFVFSVVYNMLYFLFFLLKSRNGVWADSWPLQKSIHPWNHLSQICYWVGPYTGKNHENNLSFSQNEQFFLNMSE